MSYVECPNCFCLTHEDNWSSELKVEVCGYCREHKLTNEELLERRLEIMDKTQPCHLPIILKQMYEILKEKK